jgi:hypothetical protein
MKHLKVVDVTRKHPLLFPGRIEAVARWKAQPPVDKCPLLPSTRRLLDFLRRHCCLLQAIMMRMLAVWIALLALLGPGMAQQPAGGWIQGFFSC